MHVDDQTYQRNGKTCRRALLRNSYRKNGKVQHDTIANLSMCSAEEIEAIKFALKNKKNLAALKIPQEKIQTHQGLSGGAVWLLYQLAKRLGIEKALGRLKEAKPALWMVISAVIGSVSRLSATRLAQSHAACDILRLDGFCEIFRGNTKDTQTFKSQVDKVAKRFGIEKVTFVGDRGMIKSAQISELSAEDYFITALTKPQIEKLLKEGIFQMQLFDKDICEVIEEGLRYVLRRNPIRAKEIQENRQSKLTAV
ncbi:MAG: hypothetical protein GY850_35455 [bacterium]|nr:hypothetical protein [bacterium]